MKQPDSRINYQFLFHVLPNPILLVDQMGILVDLNASASDQFETIVVGEKIENLFIDVKYFKAKLLELRQYHKVISDKAIFKTRGNEVQSFEFKLTILSESNDLFVLCLNHLDTKNELLKLEIEQTFSAELHTLKPYLNKTGKELIERKIKAKKLSVFFESEITQTNTKEFIDNRFKIEIAKQFPQFSDLELNIAYLLSVDASIKQIATICNKSANATRVLVHRMIKKTSFKNKTDFSNLLKSKC